MFVRQRVLSPLRWSWQSQLVQTMTHKRERGEDVAAQGPSKVETLNTLPSEIQGNRQLQSDTSDDSRENHFKKQKKKLDLQKGPGDDTRAAEQQEKISKEDEWFNKFGSRKDWAENGPHKGSYAFTDPSLRQNVQQPSTDGAKKKKVALIVGYCGANYKGLQMNPGEKSIEAELELALFKAGAISADNFGNLQKIGWTRSGRTDKGVHALSQVVGAKLLVHEDTTELIQNANSHLPGDIQMFDCVKVSRRFDARRCCLRRHYQYLVPSFCFAPKDKIEIKFPQQLRGVRHGNDGEVQSIARPEESREINIATQQGNSATTKICHEGIEDRIGIDEGDTRDGLAESDEDRARSESNGFVTDSPAARLTAYKAFVANQREQALRGYRMDPSDRSRVERILSHFKGTHHFHNFTSGLTSADGTVRRYMMDLTVSEPFMLQKKSEESAAQDASNELEQSSVNGIEYITISIVGQSFLLHQIRKMIAVAMMVARGEVEEHMIRQFLAREKKYVLPKAPGVGLYLVRPSYDEYEEKYLDKLQEKLKAEREKELAKKDESERSIVCAGQEEGVSRESTSLDCKDEHENNKNVSQNESEGDDKGATNDRNKHRNKGGNNVSAPVRLYSNTAALRAQEEFKRRVVWQHVHKAEENDFAFSEWLIHVYDKKNEYFREVAQ